MNAFETTNRFLVKFRDPSAAASPRISVRLGVSGPAVTFASEPLFHSIGVARAPGLAASGGAWRVATASAQLDDAEAWDHCHDILAANSERGRGRTGPCAAMARRRSERYGTEVRGPRRRAASARHRRRLLRRRRRQLLVSQQQPTTRWMLHSRRRAEARGSGSLISIPATTRPTNRFPNTFARISRIISSTRTSRTMRRIGRRERSSTISATAAARSAFWPARPCRASSRSAARRTPRSSRFGSPTGSCCSATARSRRASTTSTACADSDGTRVHVVSMSMGGLAVPGMGGRNQRALRRRASSS